LGDKIISKCRRGRQREPSVWAKSEKENVKKIKHIIDKTQQKQ
jgi:hypothetical protein